MNKPKIDNKKFPTVPVRCYIWKTHAEQKHLVINPPFFFSFFDNKFNDTSNKENTKSY